MALDEDAKLVWADFLGAVEVEFSVTGGSLAQDNAARFYHDPAGFAETCINWPVGKGLTPYQREILAAIPDKKRVSVRGPHGLGKPRRAQSRSCGLRSPGTALAGTGSVLPRPVRGGSSKSICGPRSKSGPGCSTTTSWASRRSTNVASSSP